MRRAVLFLVALLGPFAGGVAATTELVRLAGL